MILQLGSWKFDIDMETTMAYSAAEAQEHCTCTYCRNFYAALDTDLPSLRPMLAQFGIDAQAPDQLYPYDITNETMWYEGEYLVFGRILQHGKDPIVCGQCSIQPSVDAQYSVSQPYFVLCLQGAKLPWILEEPLQEVLSPANEPEFINKMMDRLVEKEEFGLQS